VFGDVRETLDTIKQNRVDDLEEAQSRLRRNLVFINIVILVSGGGVSYLLARRTLEPIEKAHLAQSRFTADASHELRTPITAMRLENEISLSDPKLSLPKAKKQLTSNIEELDKLTSLTETLLQLARSDEENKDKKTVSVNDTIHAAVKRVEKQLKIKKQTVDLKNVDDTQITVSQSSIIEALVTVLDNASKYTPTKSVITIASHTKSESVEIAITDTGPGIPKSNLPFIFDRFYRADQSRTDSVTHGYGIGLSIAKAAIEANNGTIEVAKTSKTGTTFLITLPLEL